MYIWKILSLVWSVAIDGSWIDDRIYWTLWYTHTSVHSHVFISRCSVAASNGGRSPSSGFPNCPRPQLPASHSSSSQRLNSAVLWLTQSLTNQLTQLNSTDWTHSSITILLITPRHEPHRKCRSSVAVYWPLPSNGHCLVFCFAVVA
jgi:hypothetical protein